MCLGLLSSGTLRSAEVEVLKIYERMKFKVEFLVMSGHTNKKLKGSIGSLNLCIGLSNFGKEIMHSNYNMRILGDTR